MPSSLSSYPLLLSSIGLVLSLYAVYVEYKTAHKSDEEEFTSLCDIQAIGASCSSVFALPEGHLVSYIGLVEPGSTLDVPNAMIGVVYYTLRLVDSIIKPNTIPRILIQVAATCALGASVFLAYQLTILKELCILCWSTHVLNTLLWINAMFGNKTKTTKNKMTNVAPPKTKKPKRRKE